MTRIELARAGLCLLRARDGPLQDHDEVSRVDGIGQEGSRAERLSVTLSRGSSAGSGVEDYRNLFGLRVCLQPGAHLEAIHIRQVDIQTQHVRGVLVSQ